MLLMKKRNHLILLLLLPLAFERPIKGFRLKMVLKGRRRRRTQVLPTPYSQIERTKLVNYSKIFASLTDNVDQGQEFTEKVSVGPPIVVLQVV